MNRILFIINPISGSIEKSGLKEKISHELSNRSAEVMFFETYGKEDLERLNAQLDKLNPDIVVAAGGDGTASLAARAVLGRQIRLGFLPMGSANGIATELGIPSDLTAALEVILRGHEIEMDMIRINDKYYSIHLSDVGFNAQIVKRFEQQKRRGVLTYAMMFITEFFKMKSHHYTVHTSEGKIELKAVMIVFANAGRYGTGAVINPKGRVNDGKFELIILKPYRLWHLFRMVIPVMTGKIDRLQYVDFFSGTSFTVENPEQQDLHIDGEIVSLKKLLWLILSGKR